MTLKVDIVTQERRVYSADDVEILTAPGTEGEMGIYARHAPLITALQDGVMRVRHLSGQDEVLAIHGGFMEVLPDRVTVLADVAERAEEIDAARAEAARKRAEELMTTRRADTEEYLHAEAALRRAMVRLKIAGTRRQRTQHRTSSEQ